MPEQYSSLQEVAQFTTLSTRQIQRYASGLENGKKMKSYRVGKRLLFRMTEVVAFVDELQQPPADAEREVPRLASLPTGNNTRGPQRRKTA
jgi:hypothetical protein